MNKLNRRIPKAILEDLRLDKESIPFNILTSCYANGIVLIILIIVFWSTDEESIFATTSLVSIIGFLSYIIALFLYKLNIVNLNFNQDKESAIVYFLHPINLAVQAVFSFIFGGFVQMSIYNDTLISQLTNIFSNSIGYIIGLIFFVILFYILVLKKTQVTTKDYFLKIEEFVNMNHSYRNAVLLTEDYFSYNKFNEEKLVPVYEETDSNNEPEYVEEYIEDYTTEENPVEDVYKEKQTTHNNNEYGGKMVRKRR